MLFPISHFFPPLFGHVKVVWQLKVISSFWHTLIPLSIFALFFVHWKKMTHSCRAIWSGFKAVRLNVELKLITRFMKEINDFSVLFRQRTL